MDGNLPYVYTPGIADVAQKINENPEYAFKSTIKKNSVAIVSDCSRVLGLGPIKPAAGLAVMEGKAVLFKKIADIDAFPICLDTTDEDEIVRTVCNIAPAFGGINLEDIASVGGKSFNVEDKCKKLIKTKENPIPICHDDQHGTAVVVLAAMKNALRIANKDIRSAKFVFIGCGSAGYACYDLFKKAKMNPNNADVFHKIMDKNNHAELVTNIYKNRDDFDLLNCKEKIVAEDSARKEKMTLLEAMNDADAVIGLSESKKDGNVISEEMIQVMNPETPIVFALANPYPEISYQKAKKAGAEIVATALSGTPNQVNDIISMPAIFRGALDVGATEISTNMLLAATEALRSSVPQVNDVNHIISLPGRVEAVAEMAYQVAIVAKRDNLIRNHEWDKDRYKDEVTKRIEPFW